MKKLTIVTKAADIVQSVAFNARKHSPEILMTLGIGGVAVGTVLACIATTKLSPIMEESTANINAIKEDAIVADDDTGMDKDIAMAYAITGVKLANLYLPAVSVSILSITSILASNHILKSRNVALAAAYTAIDLSFKEYRGRVLDRYGETVEREIRYNLKNEKIDEIVIGEDGKEKKVKKTVPVAGDLNNSDYVMYFDKTTSTAWEPDHEYNMMFLKSQQAHCTNRLSAKGRLFLNDVYSLIGVAPSKAGQIVGWDLSNPTSDEFVDFHILEVYRSVVDDDGVVANVKSIVLDFNVAGDVWSKMAK